MTSPRSKLTVAQLAWRIAAIVSLMLIGTVYALWMKYVDAPSPAQVCDRVIEMTYAEGATHDRSSVEALVSKLRSDCVSSKSRIIQYRGKLEWATYARCVMDAPDLAGAEGC